MVSTKEIFSELSASELIAGCFAIGENGIALLIDRDQSIVRFERSDQAVVRIADMNLFPNGANLPTWFTDALSESTVHRIFMGSGQDYIPMGTFRYIQHIYRPDTQSILLHLEIEPQVPIDQLREYLGLKKWRLSIDQKDHFPRDANEFDRITESEHNNPLLELRLDDLEGDEWLLVANGSKAFLRHWSFRNESVNYMSNEVDDSGGVTEFIDSCDHEWLVRKEYVLDRSFALSQFRAIVTDGR